MFAHMAWGGCAGKWGRGHPAPQVMGSYLGEARGSSPHPEKEQCAHGKFRSWTPRIGWRECELELWSLPPGSLAL